MGFFSNTSLRIVDTESGETVSAAQIFKNSINSPLMQKVVAISLCAVLFQNAANIPEKVQKALLRYDGSKLIERANYTVNVAPSLAIHEQNIKEYMLDITSEISDTSRRAREILNRNNFEFNIVGSASEALDVYAKMNIPFRQESDYQQLSMLDVGKGKREYLLIPSHDRIIVFLHAASFNEIRYSVPAMVKILAEAQQLGNNKEPNQVVRSIMPQADRRIIAEELKIAYRQLLRQPNTSTESKEEIFNLLLELNYNF